MLSGTENESLLRNFWVVHLQKTQKFRGKFAGVRKGVSFHRLASTVRLGAPLVPHLAA
jgi:hypothetical protein